MNLIKLQVKTNNQKYPIIIGDNIISKIRKILKKNFIEFSGHYFSDIGRNPNFFLIFSIFLILFLFFIFLYICLFLISYFFISSFFRFPQKQFHWTFFYICNFLFFFFYFSFFRFPQKKCHWKITCLYAPSLGFPP